MFKNLDGECFGIVGRQNEVIEFALSNGYPGISVDFSDLVSRVSASGAEFATRYVVSAKMLKIGVGNLSIRFHGTDEEFNADVETMTSLFEIVDAIRNVEKGVEGRVERISCKIQPYSDTLAYHENFEKQRERIGIVADRLAEKSIKLGLRLESAPSKRANKEFEFIYQAEGILSLIKAIGNKNVGLDLNTWDWQVGGGALDQLSDLTAEDIVSVTLTDIPNDADLATISNSDRMLPGLGNTEFCTKVCDWLNKVGYEGPITPGPSSSQFSGSSRDAVIHKAANNIDDILVGVGAIEPIVSDIAAAAAAAAEEKAEAEAKESDEKPGTDDAVEDTPTTESAAT